MKSYIVLFIPFTLQAQIPLISESSNWDCRIFGWGLQYFYESFCGDTIINSKTYKKLYRFEYSSTTGEISNIFFLSSVREDTLLQKSWFITQYDTAEYVFYDFSLNPGDSITLLADPYSQYFITKTVSGVGYQVIGGVNRKVITFDTAFYYSVEKWIEGIGSTLGFEGRFRGPYVDYEPYLNCYSYNGNFIYSPDTNVTVCSGPVCDSLIAGIPDEVQPSPHSLYKISSDYLVLPNSVQEVSNVKLIDISGRVIKNVIACLLNGNKIYIGDLPKGLYCVIVGTHHGASLLFIH